MTTRKWKLAVVVSLLLAGVNVNTVAAHGGDSAGGMSSGHMSAQGIRNTNGPASFDRDKGLARAEDRRSTQGAMHEHATRKVSHRHHHHVTTHH